MHASTSFGCSSIMTVFPLLPYYAYAVPLWCLSRSRPPSAALPAGDKDLEGWAAVPDLSSLRDIWDLPTFPDEVRNIWKARNAMTFSSLLTPVNGSTRAVSLGADILLWLHRSQSTDGRAFLFSWSSTDLDVT
jgi:hypothetical protein